jgi:cyclase
LLGNHGEHFVRNAYFLGVEKGGPLSTQHDDRGPDAARLQEVSDGIYAYVQPDGTWFINNTGLLVGRQGAISVDSCATERRTRRYLESIRSVTDRPVRALINTHHHGDHTHGNYVFADAAIIAHERCRETMLAAGSAAPSEAVFGTVDWGRLDPDPPFVTFTDRVDVWVDDLRCEVRHIGVAAHTTNDSIVWIPERRVMFAGDLVFNGGTPFVMMGSIVGSIEAIERLRQLDADIIVPGHGDVCGPEVFDELLAYLRFVQSTASDAVAAGQSPLEAARAVDLGVFAARSDPERIVGNLHRAFAELSGAAPGDPIDYRLAINEMVAYNGGHPLSCYA